MADNLARKQSMESLGPEALDQKQQQSVRERLRTEKSTKRRDRSVLNTPTSSLPTEPGQRPGGGAVGDAQQQSQDLPTTEKGNDVSQAGPKPDEQKDATQENPRQSRRSKIASKVSDKVVAAAGVAKDNSRMFLMLLAVAVLKDTADVLSFSLFSWIDWIIDGLLWLMFILVFGKLPKKIRLELRVAATAASIVEFIPFLDILTSWTILVLYAWGRMHSFTREQALRVAIAVKKSSEESKKSGG